MADNWNEGFFFYWRKKFHARRRHHQCKMLHGISVMFPLFQNSYNARYKVTSIHLSLATIKSRKEGCLRLWVSGVLVFLAVLLPEGFLIWWTFIFKGDLLYHLQLVSNFSHFKWLTRVFAVTLPSTTDTNYSLLSSAMSGAVGWGDYGGCWYACKFCDWITCHFGWFFP